MISIAVLIVICMKLAWDSSSKNVRIAYLELELERANETIDALRDDYDGLCLNPPPPCPDNPHINRIDAPPPINEDAARMRSINHNEGAD